MKLYKLLLLATFVLLICLVHPSDVKAETITITTEDNFTWTYDTETYVLRISGEGNLYVGPYRTVLSPDYRVEKIILEPGITAVGESTLSIYPDLKEVVLPDTIKYIYAKAFSGCSKLDTINFPDSLELVGTSAFYGCNFKELDLRNYTFNFGGGVFAGNTSLTSILLPDWFTTIEGSFLSGCTSLKSISIPDGVTRIGNNAFNKCTSLTEIRLPDSVESIGQNAFANCTNLTTLHFGSGTTEIDQNIVKNCDKLKNISYNGTSFQWENNVVMDSTNFFLFNTHIDFIPLSACTTHPDNWDGVQPPTCTKQGYDYYICKVCGVERQENFVDAIGHDFGTWKFVTDPANPSGKLQVHMGYCKREDCKGTIAHYPKSIKITKNPTSIRLLNASTNSVEVTGGIAVITYEDGAELTLSLYDMNFSCKDWSASNPLLLSVSYGNASTTLRFDVTKNSGTTSGQPNNNPSVNPDSSETPNSSETPDPSETPDSSETPNPSEIPDSSETPDSSEVPESSETQKPSEEDNSTVDTSTSEEPEPTEDENNDSPKDNKNKWILPTVIIVAAEVAAAVIYIAILHKKKTKK